MGFFPQRNIMTGSQILSSASSGWSTPPLVPLRQAADRLMDLTLQNTTDVGDGHLFVCYFPPNGDELGEDGALEISHQGIAVALLQSSNRQSVLRQTLADPLISQVFCKTTTGKSKMQSAFQHHSTTLCTSATRRRRSCLPMVHWAGSRGTRGGQPAATATSAILGRWQSPQ